MTALRVVSDTVEAVTADGLRASHSVMTSLEKCKSSSESIIDTLPDMFVIITTNGRIIKGNEEAANHMNVHPEEIIDTNLLSLFQGDMKRIFQNKIETYPEGAAEINFELPIATSEGQLIEYFWTVCSFDQISPRRGRLFRVLGRDISDLRSFEKRITQIFSAIPIGIMTVLADGTVEWPYSQYSEYLLGSAGLTGRHVDEVLFKPVWDRLDPVKRVGASQLVKSIGFDPMWFELSKLHFPSEVFRPRDSGHNGLWLGLTYHPIVSDNVVEKIIVIIEDRTEVYEARNAIQFQRHIDNGSIKKILEIQDCTGSLLEGTFTDFEQMAPKLAEYVAAEDINGVGRVLHALKGVARTAGFSDLKGNVHRLEDILMNTISRQEKPDWDVLRAGCATVDQEIRDLRTMCFALTGRNDSLYISHDHFQEVSENLGLLFEKAGKENQEKVRTIMNRLGVSGAIKPIKIRTIEADLERVARETAVREEKQVNLEFSWFGATASKEDVEIYRGIFKHLLVNAIDHGIEAPKARRAKGKPETGTIKFLVTKTNDGIEFSVSDDGQGIDTDNVLKIAHDQRLLRRKKKHVSREDVFRILVQPGFSTKIGKVGVTDRGVGLDYVTDSIRGLGSEGLNIESKSGEGAVFSFRVPTKMVHFDT